MDVYSLSLQVLLLAGVLFWAAGVLQARSSHRFLPRLPLAHGVMALAAGPVAYLLAHASMSLLPLDTDTARRAIWWGSGVAAGGCGALASLWALPAGNHKPQNTGAAANAPVLTVAAVILMLGRGARLDTLLGVGAGWLIIMLGSLQTGDLQTSDTENTGDEWRRPAHLILSSGGFAILWCMALSLSLIRENSLPAISEGGVRGGWTLVVLAAAPALVIMLIVAGLPVFGRGLLRRLPELIWLSIVTVAIVASLDVDAAGRTLIVVLTGAAGGLLMASLAGERRDENGALAGEVPLAVLLLTAGVMSAQLLLQAFGVAMMVLAAWVFVLSWGRGRADFAGVYTHRVWPLLAAGVAVVVYRLFDVRYANSLRSVNWSDTYVLAGLLTGAVTPLTLARLFTDGTPRRFAALNSLVMLLGAGLIPALAIALFGLRIAPALAMGCILACVFAPTPRRPLVVVLALWPLLLLSQWLSPLLVLADTARTTRIIWLVGAAVVFIAILELRALLGNRVPGTSSRGSAL